MNPSESFNACAAACQLAGLPMRMAVATVCGSSTAFPNTIGAAPAAWKPNMRGKRSLFLATKYFDACNDRFQ